jgi:oxygen-independent coproporphyrinogen-3 oxidase
LAAELWQEAGFGLYIHWPFCQAKCPYCDFNSHVSTSIDQDEWAIAYLSELDRVSTETSDRILGTVFFGGGTPSLMDPRLIDQIMDRVRRNWSLANDFEVTMEANPSSVEASRFKSYRAAGVDRVSLGIQALNDTDLRALGRLHSTKEARAALEIAQSCFDRASFDLIYARQDQTLADWEAELTEALKMGFSHMSLYQLTIEDGTAFGARHARGLLRGLPTDDTAANMFELTQQMMQTADMPAYEVSNHAQTGQEARHNQIYWRGGDYLGIGPGAHGRVTLGGQRYATETPLSPALWLTAVKTGGSGESARTALSRSEQDTEYLMMSLRTSEGSDLTRLHTSTRDSLVSKIRDLCDLGFLVQDEDHLSVKAEKRIVLNAILSELLC